MSDNPPSKNPPFGGSIAAETFLRLSSDDRQQAAELSRPKHPGGLLWLVQYCKHTAHYGVSNAFDSGLGCTTNWEHAKESSQQKDWKVVTYRIKPDDIATKVKQVQDICDISPHGFGKWSPMPPQNGKSDALVGTSDNLLRALHLSPVFQNPVASTSESSQTTGSSQAVASKAPYDPVRDLGPDAT